MRGSVASPHCHCGEFEICVIQSNKRRYLNWRVSPLSLFDSFSVNVFHTCAEVKCVLSTHINSTCSKLCNVPLMCFPTTGQKSEDMPHTANLSAQKNCRFYLWCKALCVLDFKVIQKFKIQQFSVQQFQVQYYLYSTAFICTLVELITS